MTEKQVGSVGAVSPDDSCSHKSAEIGNENRKSTDPGIVTCGSVTRRTAAGRGKRVVKII